MSYGSEKREQVWTLIELLLSFHENGVHDGPLSNHDVGIKYLNWDSEASEHPPSLEVTASLMALSKLAGGSLGAEQIREFISGHLSDKFLGILEDKRTQKAGRGAEVWRFEVQLWSTQTAVNRQKFEALWNEKKNTQKPSTNIDKKASKIEGLSTLESSSRGQVHCINLFNALQPYEALVNELLDLTKMQVERLFSHSISERQTNRITTSVLCQLSGADEVITFTQDAQSHWQLIEATETAENSCHAKLLLDAILPSMSQSQIFSKDSHGRILEFDEKLYILIPLENGIHASRSEPSFACICDADNDRVVLGEPFGEITSTFLGLTSEELSHISLVETRILDALKRSFNFVSPDLYERRFYLFKERLNRMTVNFQPIVKLSPLVLEAWEALARDPDTMVNGDASTMVAPVDLFEVAELWGTEFTTELDLYFLHKATERYKTLRDENRLNRYHEILPLSVNVYPSSLMRTVYLEAVRNLTDSHIIPAEKLVLEISEKSELPEPPYWSDTPITWQDFRNRLKKFVRDSPGIRFAIDDFGVGHASVSRLVGLNLEYVKIDREVLNYPEDVRNKVITFVTETLIEAGHYSPHVIVEGVDKDYPISLQDLLKIGAQSIQGYIVDKPQEKIYRRLNSEQFDALKEQLSLAST